jgi:hypothetical protein
MQSKLCYSRKRNRTVSGIEPPDRKSWKLGRNRTVQKEVAESNRNWEKMSGQQWERPT